MSTPAERRALAEAAAALRSEHELTLFGWEHSNDRKQRAAAMALEKISDTAGSFYRWPASQRTRMLSGHLQYRDRFQLTLFVLVNGVAPLLYAEYLDARGSLRDQAARDQVAGLIEAHKKNQLGKYTAWHVDMQDMIPVKLPSSFDMDYDAGHWDEAVALLKARAFRPIVGAHLQAASSSSSEPAELLNKWAEHRTGFFYADGQLSTA